VINDARSLTFLKPTKLEWGRYVTVCTCRPIWCGDNAGACFGSPSASLEVTNKLAAYYSGPVGLDWDHGGGVSTWQSSTN